LDNILKVNQRLEIMLSQNIDTPRFTSRVEEILSDEIMIAMPMHKGRPIFLESGHKFYGKIINQSGVYFFKSKFLSKKMTPLPVWIAAMPYDIEKMQQRAFVRFDVSQPLQIEYSLDDDIEKTVSLKVMTRDLSGGGLQAICSSPIKIGTKVRMLISLPEDGDLEVDGAVIRVQKPQEDRQLFWISIKFIDVRNIVRDKISRFIFKKQLEHRQKGI
jgi:c-di-GMP-binding flagellar brake protein YcgR